MSRRVVFASFFVVLLAPISLALAVPGGTAASAAASQEGERILDYDVAIAIASSGDLLVEERIEYDFGSADRHGIFRDFVLRFRHDDTYDRVYRLSGVSVSASEGTPDRFVVEDISRGERVRIGDPDRTISGRHTYVLSYRLVGTINEFDDHDELYWNTIGPGWSVPIERATVTLDAPGEIERVACFAGAVGSNLPCGAATSQGSSATFGPASLAPGDVLTVVAGLPKGAVALTAPILEERWSLDRAFSRTPFTVGGFVALLVAGIAAIGLLAWRNGRDRRWVGSFVDATFGNVDGTVEPVPIGGHGDVPVEFVPPDGLLPGQIGTLVDERANPVDVTATIVHLAVRGYLRIEELPKDGWFGKPDWRLVRVREADGALVEYERVLHEGLFRGRNDGTVELSDLKAKFAQRMREVQDSLYEDAVANGWFRARPDRIRQAWAVGGFLLAAAGVGLTVLAAVTTRLALVPVGIAITGLVLLLASRWMPHRTAKGTGVLRRALGFRRFIDESEAERARFAEQAHLFTEYLPYAIVFGATEKWARAFEGLATVPPDTSWYVGTRPFGYVGFADSLDSFSVSTAGTLTSTPSGSGGSGFGGGGFAGGGGGGGGGGSW